MKCLLCFLVGHKWFIASFDEHWLAKPNDPNDLYKKRDTSFTECSFCVRRDEHNPAIKKDKL